MKKGKEKTKDGLNIQVKYLMGKYTVYFDGKKYEYPSDTIGFELLSSLAIYDSSVPIDSRPGRMFTLLVEYPEVFSTKAHI